MLNSKPFLANKKSVVCPKLHTSALRNCGIGTPEALNVNNRRWRCGGAQPKQRNRRKAAPSHPTPAGVEHRSADFLVRKAGIKLRTRMSALPWLCSPCRGDGWERRCPPVPREYALHRRLFTLRTSGAESGNANVLRTCFNTPAFPGFLFNASRFFRASGVNFSLRFIVLVSGIMCKKFSE